MKRVCAIVLFLVLLLVAAAPAHAVFFSSRDSYSIPEGETVNESVVLTGANLSADGTVRGDVFCAGRNIHISGTVEGDVLCAGQQITVSGIVRGDVRIAGQGVALRGSVGRNVTAFAQNLTVHEQASVGGELQFGSQTVSVSGVTGPVLGGAQDVSLRGTVNGDSTLYAESVTVADTARLLGSLDYTSQTEASIGKEASFSGTVVRHEPPAENKPARAGASAPKQHRPWPQNALPSLFINTLLGLLLVVLFSRAVTRLMDIAARNGVVASVLGMILLMFAPFVVLMLLISILGIVVIPFVILAYVLAAALGRIVLGILLGKALLEGLGIKNSNNMLYQAITGIPFLWLIFYAPIVGGVITFLSVLCGVGVVAMSLSRTKK